MSPTRARRGDGRVVLEVGAEQEVMCQGLHDLVTEPRIVDLVADIGSRDVL